MLEFPCTSFPRPPTERESWTFRLTLGNSCGLEDGEIERSGWTWELLWLVILEKEVMEGRRGQFWRNWENRGVTGKEVEFKFGSLLEGDPLLQSHILHLPAALSNPVVHFSTSISEHWRIVFLGGALYFYRWGTLGPGRKSTAQHLCSSLV